MRSWTRSRKSSTTRRSAYWKAFASGGGSRASSVTPPSTTSPFTDEDRAAVKEAEAELDRGEGRSLDEPTLAPPPRFVWVTQGAQNPPDSKSNRTRREKDTDH